MAASGRADINHQGPNVSTHGAAAARIWMEALILQELRRAQRNAIGVKLAILGDADNHRGNCFSHEAGFVRSTEPANSLLISFDKEFDFVWPENRALHKQFLRRHGLALWM